MAEKKKTSIFTMVLAVLLALAFIPTIIAGFIPDDPATPESAAAAERRSREEVGLRACEQAKGVIKARLKAPASADFPDCVFGANKYSIRGSPDMKTIWVDGYVDAQNSFGANLRTQFVVQFSYEPATGEFVVAKVATR